MKIYLVSMEDPLYISPFIIKIMKKWRKDINGVAITRNARARTKKSNRDSGYVVTLFYILGLKGTALYLLKYGSYKLRKIGSVMRLCEPPTIYGMAKRLGIPATRIENANDPEFIKKLKKSKPDVIINQTQDILNSNFISSAKIGVLNRHNSLLPAHRGRLAPFWALFNGDKETGVTIHFVTTEIDKGDIIIQKRMKIKPKEEFISLVDRCYKIADEVMDSALQQIATGKIRKIEPTTKPSYHSTPTRQEAKEFRKKRADKR